VGLFCVYGVAMLRVCVIVTTSKRNQHNGVHDMNKILDDHHSAELVTGIREAIDHHAETVAGGIAAPNGYLFQEIVDAVYRGIKDAVTEHLNNGGKL